MADRSLAIARQPVIIITGAGNTTLITGVAGYRIHIVGLALTADAVAQITLQDEHTSLMDIRLVAGGVIVLPDSRAGWIRCQSGDDFVLANGTAANVGGTILYRMVPDHIEL